MKFSRNPKTGILEVYTDDGKYVGRMSTMGDTSEKDEAETKKVENTIPEDDEAIQRLVKAKDSLKFLNDEKEREELAAVIDDKIKRMCDMRKKKT